MAEQPLTIKQVLEIAIQKEISAYSKNLPSIIIGFICLTQAVSAFYAIYEMKPPAGFELLRFLGLFWLVGDWFLKDNRKYKVEWAYDMGFFLYIFWPIFIPYYLFVTRGFKSALSITLGFVALYIGTYFIYLTGFYLFSLIVS